VIELNKSPRNYQETYFKKLLEDKRHFFDWGLATGKTYIGIWLTKYLRQTEGARVLITYPSNVYRQWMNEFKKLANMEVFPLQGTKKQWLSLFDGRVHLVSHEALARRLEEHSLINYDAIIVDEVHRVKNWKSKVSIWADEQNFEYRVVLTGTKVNNGCTDMFSQYRIVDSSIFGKNYWKFVNKYFVNVGRGKFPIWRAKLGAEAVMKARASKITSTIKTKDVLSWLPEKTYKLKVFKMPAAQKKVYDKFVAYGKEFMKAQAAGEYCRIKDEEFDVTIKTEEVLKQKLLQISKGFIYNNKGLAVRLVKKTERQKELESILGWKEKTAIFYQYKEDLTRIKEVCKQHTHDWEVFQNTDMPVFITQMSSGTLGIELYKATIGVFYTYDFNRGNMEQAEGRLQREGQTGATFIKFMVRDTYEEYVEMSLNRKNNLSERMEYNSFQQFLEEA